MREAAIEFASTVRNVPAEMVQAWHDSHRWDRDKYFYEGAKYDPTGRPTVLIRHKDPDYRLWRLLGKVSDTILILIVVIVIISIGIALGG